MKHAVIMPEGSYKATTGRYKDIIVELSSMGVEVPVPFHMHRYVVSNFESSAVEQALETIKTKNPGMKFKVEWFD